MKLNLAIQTADPVHVQIEQFLRREIQSGKLPSGTRLPATSILSQQWRADHTAIQRAMTRLTADGLIERRRRRGTFVRASTDQAVIGVLIGPSLAEETAYFYRAVLKHLRAEVTAMDDRHWTCRVYDGSTEVKVKPDVQDSPIYQHLVSDLRNHTFKGIVRLSGSFFNDEASDPGAHLPQAHLGLDVTLDYYRFTWDVIKFVAQRGCRRIVYLRTLPNRPRNKADLKGLSDAARELGLPGVEIHQMQNAGSVLIEQEAHEKTLRLVDRWQQTRDWPEALLVSDDIAARGIALAMVRKGIEVPGRLLVITQANEGITHHYGIPIVRYEFSPRRVAEELLSILWKRITQDTLPVLPIRIAGQIKQ